MTLTDVKLCVIQIENDAKYKCTPEPHMGQDALFADIIVAIANGRCEDPVACCKEASRVIDMDFPRWFE